MTKSPDIAANTARSREQYEAKRAAREAAKRAEADKALDGMPNEEEFPASATPVSEAGPQETVMSEAITPLMNEAFTVPSVASAETDQILSQQLNANEVEKQQTQVQIETPNMEPITKQARRKGVRKSAQETKSGQIRFLLKPSLKLKLEEWADMEDISVNGLLHSILEKASEAKFAKTKKK